MSRAAGHRPRHLHGRHATLVTTARQDINHFQATHDLSDSDCRSDSPHKPQRVPHKLQALGIHDHSRSDCWSSTAHVPDSSTESRPGSHRTEEKKGGGPEPTQHSGQIGLFVGGFLFRAAGRAKRAVVTEKLNALASSNTSAGDGESQPPAEPNKRQEGDLEQYSNSALAQRRQLRKHPAIEDLLETFWTASIR